MGPPASLYAPSTRLLPRYTKTDVYPAHFQTRRVNDAGDISRHKSRVFISEVFRGEDIGLEKVEDNFYRISSAPGGGRIRFSALILDVVSRTVVGAGIIPGLLHQDPRYIYKGTGRFHLVLAISLRTLERVLQLQVRAYNVHQRWPELRVEFLCRARDCDRRGQGVIVAVFQFLRDTVDPNLVLFDEGYGRWS